MLKAMKNNPFKGWKKKNKDATSPTGSKTPGTPEGSKCILSPVDPLTPTNGFDKTANGSLVSTPISPTATNAWVSTGGCVCRVTPLDGRPRRSRSRARSPVTSSGRVTPTGCVAPAGALSPISPTGAWTPTSPTGGGLTPTGAACKCQKQRMMHKSPSRPNASTPSVRVCSHLNKSHDPGLTSPLSPTATQMRCETLPASVSAHCLKDHARSRSTITLTSVKSPKSPPIVNGSVMSPGGVPLKSPSGAVTRVGSASAVTSPTSGPCRCPHQATPANTCKPISPTPSPGQGAEQVTHFCRLLHEPAQESARNNGETQPMSKPLTDSQRIRKVIVELIETERAYVKDLNCLIERYLDPLKEETFLSGEDTEQIFGNIQEIVQFQKQFLRSLEEAVELEPNFSILSEPSKFRDEDLRRILFSLGGSFMYYANHFKLYSSFCASHSKAQRVLNPESNARLQEFLRARNPKQQHSATLESYLIKPIQRILKYPLLLRQLKDLTDLHTDEHHHLMEALRGMEAVAEHINEMQKIYEEYGTVFEDLIEQYKEAHPHTRALELNVGELQMYGSVNWLNALDELGKMKKGTELITLLFIFKSGVVLLSQERIRGKKNKPKASPQSKQSQPPDPSEVTNRFQAGVPVDQLQVRTAVGDEQERHGIWELAHCRSEQEGRPEKVYQFASSHAARRDFIRTINNTIRESVRRMSLPQAKGNGTIANNKGKPSNIHHHHHHHHPSQQQQQQQHRHHQHTPLEQTMSEQEYDYPDQLLLQDSNSSINNKHIPSSTGNRRPDTLVASSNTIHGTHDRVPRPQLQVRHSMDIDDRVGGRVEQQKNLSDFRTRSQTLSDLNNAGSMDEGNYQAGSQSTLASDRGSNAAKLLHSSHDPLDFNAGQPEPIENEGPGSPIWKPRNATIPPKKHVTLRGTLSDDRPSLESAVFSGSAYGDYSNVYQDTRKKQVLIIPPNSYVETEDTEC